MKIPKTLTIAGSDSGGGAGIQADLKTFAALGVYGASVITAITAQNTWGVKASAGIAADLVDSQLEAVLSDIGADAAKTGMLFDETIIEAVSDRLKIRQVPCLVVDPVMVATSGDRLLSESGVNAMRDRLLPMADFTTPNQVEASVLCGFSIYNDKDLRKAAEDIHKRGSRFVIITGVRNDGQLVDHCYDGFEHRKLQTEFIDTPHTHGTGCSFSAALAAYSARGFAPWSAAAMAQKYITSGLRYGYPVGGGRGPLNHQALFYPGNLIDVEILETRARAFQDWGIRPGLGSFPLLNVIIGGPLCQGRDYIELTREAVQNGAGLIQLREKEGETRQLIDLAREMRRVCHEHNALFIVNDRVDVAIASGADGVHIGQDDLPPRMARALLGPGKIIGVSAADMEEAEAAVAAGADYLGVGPVYPTTSKECAVKACGVETLASIASQMPVPVLAIGGITPENTRLLLEAGVCGVAVISSVLGAKDPAAVIREFIKIFADFSY